MNARRWFSMKVGPSRTRIAGHALLSLLAILVVLPACVAAQAVTMDTLETTCGVYMSKPWGNRFYPVKKPGPVFLEVDVQTLDRKPFAGNMSITSSGFSLSSNLYTSDAGGQDVQIDERLRNQSLPPVRAQFNITAGDVAKPKSPFLKVWYYYVKMQDSRDWSGVCRYMQAGTKGRTTPLMPDVPKTPYKRTFACGRPRSGMSDEADDRETSHHFEFIAQYPSTITFQVTHDHVPPPLVTGQTKVAFSQFQAILQGGWFNRTSGPADVPTVSRTLTLDDGMRLDQNLSIGILDVFSRLPDSPIPYRPKWKGTCVLTVDMPFPIVMSSFTTEYDSTASDSLDMRMLVKFSYGHYIGAGLFNGLRVPPFDLKSLNFIVKDLAGNDISHRVKKRSFTFAPALSGGGGSVEMVYDLLGVWPTTVVGLRPHLNETIANPTWNSPTTELISTQSFRATIPPEYTGRALRRRRDVATELTGVRPVDGGGKVEAPPPPLKRVDASNENPPFRVTPTKTPPESPPEAPPAKMPPRQPSAPPAVADSTPPIERGCTGGCFDATASGAHTATLSGHAMVEQEMSDRFRIVFRSERDDGHYVAFTREDGGAPRAGAFVIGNYCGEDIHTTEANQFRGDYVVNDYRKEESTVFIGSSGTLTIESITATRVRGRFTLVACRENAEGKLENVRVRGTFDAVR